MKRLTVILLAVLGVVLIGAFVLLANWTIPAPSKPVERVIPNDKLPR